MLELAQLEEQSLPGTGMGAIPVLRQTLSLALQCATAPLYNSLGGSHDSQDRNQSRFVLLDLKGSI